MEVEDGIFLFDKDIVTPGWAISLLPKSKHREDRSRHHLQAPTANHWDEVNLGVELTEGEIAIALQAIANSKDGHPTELYILRLNQNRSILRELHIQIKITWREGNVPRRWKDTIIVAIHKKMRHKIETTAIFLLCLTQEHGIWWILREKWTGAGRTEKVSPVPIDHKHCVCCSPTAGTREDYRSITFPLLYWHSKDQWYFLIGICCSKCSLVLVRLCRWSP